MSVESDLLKAVEDFLRSRNVRTRRSYKFNRVEIDLVGTGKYDIREDRAADRDLLYAFEAKIATTQRLVRDVLEQAVTRLLFADYSIVVVPCVSEVWVSDKEKRNMDVAQELKRRARGVYSQYLGIICVDGGTVKIVRRPTRSTIIIPEIRDRIIRELNNAVLF